jgi:hypothetical protein
MAVLFLGDGCQQHVNKIDPITAHKLDFKDAVNELPAEWIAAMDTTPI